MTYYETQEEAEKATPEPQSLGFCPVINESCRIDCICFTQPGVRLIAIFGKPAKFQIYASDCSHSLISGTIYIEQ